MNNNDLESLLRRWTDLIKNKEEFGKTRMTMLKKGILSLNSQYGIAILRHLKSKGELDKKSFVELKPDGNLLRENIYKHLSNLETLGIISLKSKVPAVFVVNQANIKEFVVNLNVLSEYLLSGTSIKNQKSNNNPVSDFTNKTKFKIAFECLKFCTTPYRIDIITVNRQHKVD